MDVTVANIGSVLTDVERTLEPINKYLVQILIIVGFTACIVLTCFQVINMLLRKSELGILYASGIGLKDMNFYNFMGKCIEVTLCCDIIDTNF